MANPIIEDIKLKVRSGNPVTRLIIINVLVFLTISTFRILLFVFGGTAESVVNSFVNTISFPLSIQGLIYQPWSLLTYMFTHIDIMHLFWNMVTLFWFGQILISYTSSKKIIPLYILGGIAGGLFTMVCFLIIPSFHAYIGAPLIGASAGVTAIIIASATLVPNYQMNLMFIGPVKLIYVALFVLFVDILSVTSYANVGGNLAHIGGAIMGYVFIVRYKKGNDWSLWINSFFDFISALFSKMFKSKMKVAYRRTVSDEEYNYNKNVEQAQIDAILDKISKSGYESLTKAEKEMLFKVSKKK